MRETLKEILPAPIVKWLGHLRAMLGGQYERTSYSQEGEDLILERLFSDQKSGFYVDVGAHHPIRFSNTYHFYRRGWNGINIEPNPEAVKLFRRRRKRDINLEYGVADSEGKLAYFMFNEPALNSFDKELSEKRQNNRYRLVGTKNIAVKRLAGILKEFKPAEVHIDFMTIDVEGYDFQVLKSNDWSHFRPTCVLVEVSGFDLGNPDAQPIHTFLEQQNYELFAKTFNTLFYLDRARHGPNGDKAVGKGLAPKCDS